MGHMDQICSACQAGMCSKDHSADSGLHPDDKRHCVDCDEVFNARSARLGSDRCPRCSRREDERRH